MSYLDTLNAELRGFSLEVSPSKAVLLSRYCGELERWNKKINLTALRGAEMVRRLVVEPVWLAREIGLRGRLADIGSGNGSPAIPLHIVAGFSAVHMIEPRSKRAAFLRHVASVLELPEARVHRGRFEEIAAELPQVDWITLQGLTLTPELLNAIKISAAPTTNVVWITSGAANPGIAAQKFEVPQAGAKAFVFRLDQS